MAGNSNSGRKSNYERARNGDLLVLCTDWIINNFASFDKETKIKVALEIAKKGIVQQVEANINHTAKTILEVVKVADKTTNRVTNHV